jgi:ABC-2 type transport system ATP-binding protein
MLSVRNYSKGYDHDTIISIPELNIDAGLYWIKGANGSGKSTFLKSLAGLIPFKGNVILNSVDLNDQPIIYRTAVTFSEAEPIYPDFVTPNDLLEFIGHARKSNKEELDHYLKSFSIGNYCNKPFRYLSSGMAKKVSLATAFLGTPKLMLLDEPFITLDPDAVNILNQLIKDKIGSKRTF